MKQAGPPSRHAAIELPGCIYPRHEPQYAHARSPRQGRWLEHSGYCHAECKCCRCGCRPLDIHEDGDGDREAWRGVLLPHDSVEVGRGGRGRENPSKGKSERHTYRIANRRALKASIGKRAKQITKQTSAATLHAPNIISRSHLLTTTSEYHVSITVSTRPFQPGARLSGQLHDTMRVTTTGTQELGASSQGRPTTDGQIQRARLDLHAKKPSSSSLRLGAGNGAPGPSSWVGSLT